MCFFTEQKGTRRNAKLRFNIGIDDEEKFLESEYVEGWKFPNLPIIINETPEIISTNFEWGLMPGFKTDNEFRLKKINARIETIDEKPSYKNVITNRCLIISTSYFEWHWNDPKGISKTKYQIFSQDNEIFCFAGLYHKGVNPANGDRVNTFTMVTTEANELMKYVHNHKQRMPIMLNRNDEAGWLDPANDIQNFAYPKYDASIIAFPIE